MSAQDIKSKMHGIEPYVPQFMTAVQQEQWEFGQAHPLPSKHMASHIQNRIDDCIECIEQETEERVRLVYEEELRDLYKQKQEEKTIFEQRTTLDHLLSLLAVWENRLEYLRSQMSGHKQADRFVIRCEEATLYALKEIQELLAYQMKAKQGLAIEAFKEQVVQEPASEDEELQRAQ